MKQRMNLIILLSVVATVAFFVGLFSYKMWLMHNDVDDLSLREKQTESDFELDAEYEERISAVYSNIEICDVNAEFAEKWRSKANDDYDNVLAIASEDLRQALIIAQEEWEGFIQVSIKERHHYLEQVYGSGTIVPVLLSKYEYALQRERAIELYYMYISLK